MEDFILKKESETDFEWKIRLCNAKLDKEIDYDWAELITILKLECSSDHLRKLSYAYKEFSVYISDKQKDKIINNSDTKLTNEEDDFIHQLEDKIEKLEKERKKLQATKIEKNRNQRVESRFELLYENIKEAIETIEPPTFEPVYPINGKQEHVAVVSDIHFGAKFISITNTYSREECIDRFNKLLGELVVYIKENKLNKIKLINGGDSLQGMLRISDVRMNDVPVVDALVEFSKIMITFLNDLSKYCNVEYYHVNSANHMELRLLNASAGQMAVEDMEKIIVNYISDALVNNERVFVNTEFNQDNIQIKVLEYNVIALHGHQLNNVKTALRDLSDKYDKSFDFLILGHYHSGVEMVVGERKTYAKEVLVCPSFIGTCPYADKLMVGGKSTVKIHMFEEGKGRRRTENITLN